MLSGSRNIPKIPLMGSPSPVDAEDGAVRSFADLSSNQQQERIKDRLKKYCQKAHRRVMNKSVTETRTAGICQRENDFYVGTVLAFRDRRYEYKGLVKKWKKTLKKAQEDKITDLTNKQTWSMAMETFVDNVTLFHQDCGTMPTHEIQ